MDLNLKTLGIFVVIFFIGYFIGLVESSIKQKNKDKKKIREEEGKVEPLPAPVKEPNLLSINRNPSNTLQLEMEGQAILNKDELTPENKQKLANLLVELRPWVETAPATPNIPLAETQPGPPSVRLQAAPSDTPPTPPAQSNPARSTDSIVSQIDTILQTRLAVSHLAGQGIRLQEVPGGGVVVFVGLQKYESIDAVPNPEIKAFIQQAVAEWEKQS